MHPVARQLRQELPAFAPMRSSGLGLLARGATLAGSFGAILLAPAFAAVPAVMRRSFGGRAEEVGNRGAAEAPGGSAVTTLAPKPFEPEEPRPAARCARVGAEFISTTANKGPHEHCLATTAPPVSDIAEAVGFALRRLEARAASRRVEVVVEFPARLAARCHHQTGRRVAYALIEAAITRTAPGGTVRIAAKRLKGAILLRVSAPADPPDKGEGGKLAALLCPVSLRDAVEAAGGTAVFESSRGVARVSVRLVEFPEAT